MKSHIHRKRRKLTIQEKIALEESKQLETQKKIEALQALQKKQAKKAEKDKKEKDANDKLYERYEALKKKNKEEEDLLAVNLKSLEGEDKKEGLAIVQALPPIHTVSPTESILSKGFQNMGTKGAGTK